MAGDVLDIEGHQLRTTKGPVEPHEHEGRVPESPGGGVDGAHDGLKITEQHGLGPFGGPGGGVITETLGIASSSTRKGLPYGGVTRRSAI